MDVGRLISMSMRAPAGVSEEDRSVTEPLVKAMRAGLSGEKMPNLGNWMPRGLVLLVNTVYDEARNWEAGRRVRAS